MVFCALNLSMESPAWAYRGFFQRTLFAIDAVWSRAHGWPPDTDCLRPAGTVCAATHIDDFGRFYARTVEFLSPALGFAGFWLLARRRGWRRLWKPLVIVTVAGMLPLSNLGLAQPWSEVVRTVMVVLAMIGSAGAWGIAGRQEAPGLELTA